MCAAIVASQSAAAVAVSQSAAAVAVSQSANVFFASNADSAAAGERCTDRGARAQPVKIRAACSGRREIGFCVWEQACDAWSYNRGTGRAKDASGMQRGRTLR